MLQIRAPIATEILLQDSSTSMAPWLNPPLRCLVSRLIGGLVCLWQSKSGLHRYQSLEGVRGEMTELQEL